MRSFSRSLLVWSSVALAAGALCLPAAAQSDATACPAGRVAIPARNERDRIEIIEALAPGEVALDSLVTISDTRLMPRLINPGTVTRLLQRHFPMEPRDRGIGGEVRVLARIDEAGRTGHVRVIRGGPGREFDEAAVIVIREMRFRPARYEACAVPVWVILPVTFSPG